MFEESLTSHCKTSNQQTFTSKPGKIHRRILLLSQGVLPLVSGAAIVVGNLARQFSREEMIVAGEQPFNGATFTWREEWPPIFYLIKEWPWRGRRWWRKLVFPLLLFRCIRLARRQNCDTLLVVFPNEHFLFAGYLTAKWTGAALFPYFHNTYLENRTGSSRRFARWLQNRVFSEAKHVFVMSEGIVELYRERYPGLNCSALVHSLSDEIPAFVPPPEGGSALRLTISGNINESCREATSRICDAVSQVEDASLTFLSGTSRSYMEKLGFVRNGTQHATVSHDELMSRLAEADIVVLPHGFSGGQSAEEYRTIFPTRTLEYLVCGRPILAHTPPDCYLIRFLRKQGCALVIDRPNVSALVDAIKQLRDDSALRADLVRKALHTAEMFRGSSVAATLRARIDGANIPPRPVLPNDKGL